MNNEPPLIFPAIIAAIFIFGIVFGIYIAFQRDTYECTIKCPNNVHSISINQTCYCEVK